MAIKRNPVTGKIIAKRFTLARLKAACGQYAGFCLACGAEAMNVEPDARGYKCEGCEMNLVYGAEEIMMRQFA